MLHLSLIFISLLVGTSLANNDWSQPCLSGVCQYDLPSNGSASGTLKIWGSDNAISDITTAAGWQIIDCSPSALQQDIRLVCASGNSNCTHLYDGSGDINAAVGKVVRLPESCGQSAFAVVTKSWTPQDQSIPSSITPSNGAKPTVRGLHLSTSFSSIQPSSAGPVNFVLQAANVPGAKADLPTNPQQQRRSNSRIFGRSLGSFVRDAVNDISSLDHFNVNKSITLQPLDVDKSFNLVNQNISCPPVSASVKVDVDAKAHAVASFGVAASGTIVPTKVTDFSIIAGLNANIDGSVDLKATASGSLDSGKIKLFSVGIPGLDFPGILTIGPSFEIDGQATATLDVDVDMTVGISYTIDNAQLTFPPKSSSKGTFNIGDTPLKLSASPSVTATGTVEAHLIPTLNFGISALDGAVGATIFVALDASATMTLTGQASADASATVNTKRDLSTASGNADDRSDSSVDDDASDMSDNTDTNSNTDPSSDAANTSTDNSNTNTSSVSPNAASSANADTASSSTSADGSAAASITPDAGNVLVSTNASATFGGCFSVDAALDVNAGATGDFFGLFNPSTTVDLFNHKFEIFKKCFGSSSAQRRSLPARISRSLLSRGRYSASSLSKRSLLEGRGFSLTCPSAAGGNSIQQTVVDETVPASE
ncbi:hypothetical protein CPB84DRAFT_1748022 [Gymnopilus junonius]|uniref:DUF7223 domain-containing protein n=1 Tax=Gymnopilus junonius TaxID=109634 RepID=A0A9P5TM87_GYMJU|nr:hypothetical protein CPB84DRAFT_1748022 [Gymnopilus junonius]